MLSRPKNGWTYFSLGHLRYHLSYIFDDIPIDWIEASIRGLKLNEYITVKANCEPGTFQCIVHDEYCNISFTDGDCYEDITINVTMSQFCQNLLHDIKEYYTDWLKWELMYFDEDEMKEKDEYYQKRNKELTALIDELSLYLNSFA